MLASAATRERAVNAPHLTASQEKTGAGLVIALIATGLAAFHHLTPELAEVLSVVAGALGLQGASHAVAGALAGEGKGST